MSLYNTSDMESKKQTEEEKVVEAFQAYKTGSLAGLKELARKRNEEARKEPEENFEIEPQPPRD